ncbi:hypothetical protein CPC08DRAFT_508566 [Agrocybe pediades]|nr:hypothetical protein CPC08DRAFT_508566 [Agrocybe pediades]
MTATKMLPTMGKQKQRRHRACFSCAHRRRWIALGVIASVLFVLRYAYHYPRHSVRSVGEGEGWRNLTGLDLDSPPTFEKLWKWEDDLPQHDPDLPFPEGRMGRYLFFDCQIQGLGWNNQLNEVLMNAWLAYKSKRAYVFHHYRWKPEYYPWPERKSPRWPPLTPANALMSGPAVGGPFDPGDNDAPRSVNIKYFNQVCPPSSRRVINTKELKSEIRWEAGDVIFSRWEKLLREAPERCIEIQPESQETDGFPQVFDLFLWGLDRILPLWKGFRDSPISRLLCPSPVVQSTVDRNTYLFLPRGPRPELPVSNNPYDRMLAIHLRRGDFKKACLDLANWNSTFYS